MNGIVEIPVFRGREDRGGVVIAHALVDESDASTISSYYWTLDPQGYVARRPPRPNHRRVLMHQQILGDVLTPGLVTDHINRNPLDNRRANLRAVTRAENNQNRNPYRNGSSSFRGVSWHADKHVWRATAQIGGEWKFLGYFDDEQEAARIVSEWRSKNMPYSFEAVA